MTSVHMTEAELASDLHAVLEQVRRGVEVVIEQDSRAVAVLKPAQTIGRPISEIIAELEERGSGAVIDDEFADDIKAGRDAQGPWNPPSWD